MPKKYLGLPELNTISGATDYTLAHAPLNSSGDIYHILAYLILVSSFKYDHPNLMLTYDTDDTEMQANRSMNFANVLGYSSLFKKQKIPVINRTYRENVRQKSLENYIQQHEPTTVYVDQMATTTIIAKLFMLHGMKTITEILREGFSKRESAYFPKPAQKKVDEFVEGELKSVNQGASQKPLLVLHLRYAKTANQDLNIPDDLVSGLIAFLDSKGYRTWCVMADDRQDHTGFASQFTTHPFRNAVASNGMDCAKFQHLDLMSRIAKLSQIKGVIGNTSGTLDLAAFLGNRVYNIHQFNHKITYQSFRLTMQMTFLSVDDFKKDKVAAEVHAKRHQALKLALPQLEPWLMNEAVTPSITSKSFKLTKTKAGFKKMFTVQYADNLYPIADVDDLVLGLKKLITKGEAPSLMTKQILPLPAVILNATPAL